MTLSGVHVQDASRITSAALSRLATQPSGKVASSRGQRPGPCRPQRLSPVSPLLNARLAPTKLVLALYTLALHTTPMTHIPLFVGDRGIGKLHPTNTTTLLIRPIISAIDRFNKRFTFLEV